jgi:hypothetical protein
MLGVVVVVIAAEDVCTFDDEMHRRNVKSNDKTLKDVELGIILASMIDLAPFLSFFLSLDLYFALVGV